jgi:acyl-CoA thioesterase-1
MAAQVVALGASNTEGKGRGSTPDGVSRAQAYPAQLESLLSRQGCKVSVLNAGIAGDTTTGMLKRAPGVLGKDTKVLILQPGGNDARRGEGGNVAGNVAAIRQLASSRGIQVIMLESLGQIAGSGNRTPDGQHFNAAGHANMAAWLAPRVRAAGACG